MKTALLPVLVVPMLLIDCSSGLVRVKPPEKVVVRSPSASVTAPSGLPVVRRAPDLAGQELLRCYERVYPTPGRTVDSIELRLVLSESKAAVELVNRRDESAVRLRGCVQATVKRWQWDVPATELRRDLPLVFDSIHRDARRPSPLLEPGL